MPNNKRRHVWVHMSHLFTHWMEKNRQKRTEKNRTWCHRRKMRIESDKREPRSLFSTSFLVIVQSKQAYRSISGCFVQIFSVSAPLTAFTFNWLLSFTPFHSVLLDVASICLGRKRPEGYRFLFVTLVLSVCRCVVCACLCVFDFICLDINCDST